MISFVQTLFLPYLRSKTNLTPARINHRDQRLRPTMSPVQLAFQKTAAIYRSARFISVETLSGAPGLVYREDEPYRIYLHPDATNELLGRTLLTALNKSRFVDNTEPEFFDRIERIESTRLGRRMSCNATASRQSAMRSSQPIGVGPQRPMGRLQSNHTVPSGRSGEGLRPSRRSSFQQRTTPKPSERRCASP
jgi:hypothetical protein